MSVVKYMFIILLASFIVAGCTKKIVKPFFHIAGEWEFVQFEYQSERGTKIVSDTLVYTVTFENCNDKKENDPDRCNGKINLDNGNIVFDYLASPGSIDGDAINMSIPKINQNQSSYSFEILGHYYVYYANYSDDTLELITSEQPLVNAITGEVFHNPKWIFRRK